MDVYLPIAEISLSVFLLLGLGAIAGVLAGLFGVGGGFLLTPLLIFVGVPPTVAVASQANQVIATSISGLATQWKRGTVDLRMGMVMLIGGLAGSTAGVWLFGALTRLGQIDLTIQIGYVLLLGSIGTMMLVESYRAWRRRRANEPVRRKLHQHFLVHRLPFKLRFYKSKLYVSALLPLGLGFLIGVLSALLGIGGGFVLVPAMIYLIGMPTLVAIGTSSFQILFVAINVTFLQAVQNQTVDVVLALMLILGGAVGAPIGARLAVKLPGFQLRGMLSILILGMALELLFELLAQPAALHTLGGSVATP
ncbi:MAG: sulfite exporter TauE/SafE family protein [Rhodospirillales bacterium]|nr:MAG: sulfite exporter TauE/SafE family protein [Rhodospirillales bacterium]